MQKKITEQKLKEYETKSEAIRKKMLHILIRAQRAIDDKAYRQTLEKLEEDK